MKISKRALNGDSQRLFNLVIATIGVIAAMILFGMAIAGGVNMMQLRRRWLALFAAYVVVSLALIGFYFVLAVPFGVWGLVLLYRRDVRREFSPSKRTASTLEAEANMSDAERRDPTCDDRRARFNDIRDDFDEEFGRSLTPREVRGACSSGRRLRSS